MIKLSTTPVKDEYKAHSGEVVLLGTVEVRVVLDRVDTRSGSWERGFKFGSITYGVLKRTHVSGKGRYPEYSYDHGATWNERQALAKKAKGKVIVERSTPVGEFAFSSIQRINQNYDHNYKWKP